MTLVTGASGFIGSHLVQKLTSLGERVRCLVRRKTALPPGAEAVYGDLTSGQGLDDALRGVDSVIHLAGVTKALHREDYDAGNRQATETLARALAGHRVRLVHVSSLAAIGPGSGGTPVTEDAEPHPLTSYGRSKLESERVVRRLIPDAVIVRPPVVYGPRDTDVYQLLKSISKGLVLEISGGERWFSAIYVEDLAEGLIVARDSPNGAGRAYFLAYPKPASWSELSGIAARLMGRTPRVLRVAPGIARAVGFCAEIWARARRKPGIISREKVAEAQCMWWTCDTRRAAAELHFEARTSLEAGLARTLGWYKEAGWLSY
jgi:dihydroflavonol-4-reductase